MKDLLELEITIKKSKTDYNETGFLFPIIRHENEKFSAIHYYEMYLEKMKMKSQKENFFKNYNKKSGLFIQTAGINTIAKLPKRIAEYLQLPNPEKYTGHSLRRTGATFLVEAGLDLVSLKRWGRCPKPVMQLRNLTWITQNKLKEKYLKQF